ncbi:MAG TPA: methyltransferase domain-containing protein [Stellaceae bacterium]|nr:methyltransferase domain-containing protein [Stellaceae bacterium]
MTDQLLIGCGSRRVNLMRDGAWDRLVTLDINPDHRPDVEWDLSRLPLPFGDESFDEIHAYEVLEHVGRQGDYRFFFAQFGDFWRILRPGGLFVASVPMPGTGWAWGDPSHTRVISRESITFLIQPQYDQVGKTSMSDFRHIYREDFDLTADQEIDGTWVFALRAVKPSRVHR